MRRVCPADLVRWSFIFFFFNDTATTEIYTLSLHDALPISTREPAGARARRVAKRPRVRVVCLVAHVLARDARLALKEALRARGGRRRHRADARDRLRPPAATVLPGPQPMGDETRLAARHELPLQPARAAGKRRDSR